MSKPHSDVFISYSTDAKLWAEKLADSLERRGVLTWTDFRSIQPGQRWLTEVERALDDAKCFLLIVGPNNAIGEWQDREWQGALQRAWTDPNKRIIPVLIDGATPPPFLKDWMFVRVQPGKTESSAIDKIYDAVRGKVPIRIISSLKQKAKPSKEFRSRLEEIESAARQLKSIQG